MLRKLNAQAYSFTESAQNLAAISEEAVASMEEIKASVDEVARLSEENSESLARTNSAVDEVPGCAELQAAGPAGSGHARHDRADQILFPLMSRLIRLLLAYDL